MGDTRQLRHYQRDLPFGLGPDAGPASPTAEDPEGALALLVSAAQEGHLLARSFLGRVLLRTRGRAAEGVHWLREAAAAGEPLAKHWLGLACYRGQGTRRDREQARRLQREAAEQGVIEAQFELSLLLAQGLGGEVDAGGARRWELRAAQAGHARACLNRGARLAGGKRPAFAEAARWYARAAEGGNAEAAARLCKMQVAGQGVPRDEARARRWYARAAALGYRWDDGDQAGAGTAAAPASPGRSSERP